ncbi:MAG: hypothetical protein HY587_06900 [Candidatus Omnitrophica bacterium]|nr:hypothetical protein [Candidatus Omnitrophota bacterium]
MPGKLNNFYAFSYLEILLTLLILSIFFLPCMEMFSRSVAQLNYISEMNTALALAREGMERIRNFRLSENQLIARGDAYFPLADEPPIELNGSRWRIHQYLDEGTDPLKIHVAVFKDEILTEPLVSLATLIEDVNT